MRRGKGPRSAEVRAKISAAHKGVPLSPKHRAACAEANGRPERRAQSSNLHKGKVISAESLAKMSASQKGHVTSEATKAKLSAAGKGRSASDETRAKISRRLKGREISPEWRKKMSEAAIRRCQREKMEAEQKVPRGTAPP